MSMWRSTMRNLLSKPATRLYPAVPANLAEDTRGRIVYDMSKCIFCGLCERRCPTNAIIMDKANKRQSVSRARCIACGVCVENCPTDAIEMRPEYAPPATAPELHVYGTTLTEHQFTVLSLPPFERGRPTARPSAPPEAKQPEIRTSEIAKVEARISLDSPASSIMSIRVLTLYEDDTVRKALQIMVNQKIGGLPIVDINFKVLGIVTGTDVAKAAGKEKEGILSFLFPKEGKKDVAEEARLRKIMDRPIREIMTSPVITAPPETPLREIAAIMGRNAFDRVPIVGPDERLVGIVTRRDILRAIAGSIEVCP
jgi:ech hydrogenase subunit F